MQGLERWPLVLAFGAADAVILVDADDLPAGPAGHLAQLPLLVSRGLIERGNPEIQNCALHRRPPIAMHGAYHKSLVKSPLFAHKAASGNSVDFTVTRNTDFRDGFSTQRSDTARISASIALLDRGFGRPAQSVDLNLTADVVSKRLSELSDAELAALEARMIALPANLALEAFPADDPDNAEGEQSDSNE